ncbi:hypothetical protein M406DRAFT_71456 [Cryphonectria parasitica EP155]|uniref:Uncharacterized protein n=1 Tax=Cryphonectria parasitica (strain ATCC 38755 / EP155) TaxID=660469 RepID=A0A9P4Y809_CRYP1|nr:uncharacterized protein M406DRAFT_71456 [Cryphonectria parasitica EP155]KAF3768448.1 hypothetical protein M406DRAFT_71456 [Cryphonectria parasitica EP155]
MFNKLQARCYPNHLAVTRDLNEVVANASPEDATFVFISYTKWQAVAEVVHYVAFLGCDEISEEAYDKILTLLYSHCLAEIAALRDAAAAKREEDKNRDDNKDEDKGEDKGNDQGDGEEDAVQHLAL